MEGRIIEAATDALEPRGRSVDLRAFGGIDRRGIAFDLAVVDVHVRVPGGDANAFRGDVAVGDVNLTAILGRDRIAIEFQIPIVDLQKAIALADDRVMPALDR